MDLNQQQNILTQMIQTQIRIWFDIKNESSISKTDVYCFLYLIHGNAERLGFKDIYNQSALLLEQVVESDDFLWNKEELRSFLPEWMITENNEGNPDINYEHYMEETGERTLYISIIDDDKIIQSMLLRIIKTMAIESFNVDLEAFEDGVQFFESGRLNRPGEHLLIVDGVMPIMDGIEVLQMVKNKDTESNVLVMMLSGRKGETDIEKALKLGADDYVTKPFSIKELQARIERLIKRMG